MSDINVNNDYTKMNNLSPFKLCVIQNFPFIEADFDAVTNYQLLCKVVEYLNNVIDNNNKQNSNITQLEQNFITLYNYVKDYFDNLDVQEEINTKLDEMAADGSLSKLIQPLFDEYKTSIDSEVNTQNEKIVVLENRMNTFTSLPSGSTSGDAELMDIRVAFNGTTYKTAGDSVRKQADFINDTFSSITGMININTASLWERKGIWNGSKGASIHRICTISYLSKNINYIKAINEYNLNLWAYDVNNNPVGCWNGDSFVNSNTDLDYIDLKKLREKYDYNFYLVLYKSENVEIDTLDYNNAILLSGTPLWENENYLKDSDLIFKSSDKFLFSSTFNDVLTDFNNSKYGYYYCYFSKNEIAENKCPLNIPKYGMSLNGAFISFLNSTEKAGSFQYFFNTIDNKILYRFNNGSIWSEWTILNRVKNVIEVSKIGGKDFKTINEAISYIENNLTGDNTILLYPGIYEEKINIQNKNISIIGVNKKDCIIINKDGEYDDAPIFASGNFMLKNLTVISNHSNNPNFINTRTDDYKIGGYGIHLDNSNYSDENPKLGIIENCYIYSQQNQAVGIGLAKNCKYIIRDCTLVNDTPDEMYELYTRPLKTGALGCHRGYFNEKFYQILIVDSCNLYVNKGVSLQLGPFVSDVTGVEEHFYRNMLWSGTLGKSDDSIYTYTEGSFTTYELSNDSYNNNVNILNK